MIPRTVVLLPYTCLTNGSKKVSDFFRGFLEEGAGFMVFYLNMVCMFDAV